MTFKIILSLDHQTRKWNTFEKKKNLLRAEIILLTCK